MKFISIIVAMCAVSVHGQDPRRGPPRPPPAAGSRIPVQMPEAVPEEQQPSVSGIALPSSIILGATMTTGTDSEQTQPDMSIYVQPSAQPVPPVSKRPKGCSPGCGPTEICAELGQHYCSPSQQTCSVCIKMSSIRFPASAISNMFQQQQQPAALPVAPVLPAEPATGFQYDVTASQAQFPQNNLYQYDQLIQQANNPSSSGLNYLMPNNNQNNIFNQNSNLLNNNFIPNNNNINNNLNQNNNMNNLNLNNNLLNNNFNQNNNQMNNNFNQNNNQMNDNNNNFEYIAQTNQPATQDTNAFNLFGVDQTVNTQPQPEVPAQDPAFGYYPPQSNNFDLFGFNTGFNSGFGSGFGGGNNNNFFPFMLFDPFGFGFGF